MASVDDWSLPRRCTSAERMMWITTDRIFYAGLLGSQSVHTLGAVIAYVAIEGMLRVRVDGGEWQTTEVAVVQPYVPYEIACEGRHILDILIEPESVDLDRLPPLLRACGAVDAPAFAAHVRRVHQRLVASGSSLNLGPSDFDLTFFGEPLASRTLDPRIATVLDSIRNKPSAVAAAKECAALVDLSFSRFLHLFKEQVGAPFRNVRTWKRARSLLHYVQTTNNLLHLALDIGYPDSTHFSHSIRQAYGLKPKDIIAGSRKLRIIAHASAS
jgi:AraC-like DNA-binding protein